MLSPTRELASRERPRKFVCEWSSREKYKFTVEIPVIFTLSLTISYHFCKRVYTEVRGNPPKNLYRSSFGAINKAYKTLRIKVEHTNKTTQKMYEKSGFIEHN